MPNLLPDWHFFRPAGRLIWFTIIFVIMLMPVLVALRRPKPDRPSTWAMAMVGSVYVFALMLLVYAIIPHEFMQFSEAYLQWDKNHYLVKSTTAIPFMTAWNWPFSIDMAAVRDIVAVGIYGLFFVGNVALFVLWQKRPTESEAAAKEPVPAGRSRFGRPLKARA